MDPQDIPFLVCGTFCLIPLLCGVTGFVVPFLFAKRLPVLQVRRWIEKYRKHIALELSLETRQSLREMKQKDKAES